MLRIVGYPGDWWLYPPERPPMRFAYLGDALDWALVDHDVEPVRVTADDAAYPQVWEAAKDHNVEIW